jgi:hypothetical protein
MVTKLPSGIVWAISAVRSLGMWLCELHATMSVGALIVDMAGQSRMAGSDISYSRYAT